MKNSITLFHNPKCSKSREALGLLQKKLEVLNVVFDVVLNVVNYLETPLTELELKSLIQRLGGIEGLIRSKEDLFKAEPFDVSIEADVIAGILKNPKIMERPIVVFNERAVIARPLEKIEELF